MEIEDEERTCLIPKKVEVEQGKARLNIALSLSSQVSLVSQVCLYDKSIFFFNEKYDFFY